MEARVSPPQIALKIAKRAKRVTKFWLVVVSGGIAVVLLQPGVYARNAGKADSSTAISSISDPVVTQGTDDRQAQQGVPVRLIQ
jgi:hypothetical protein